jgi:hypothetical protein
MSESEPIVICSPVEILDEAQRHIALTIGIPTPMLLGEAPNNQENIASYITGFRPFTFNLHVDQDKVNRIVEGAIVKGMKTYGPQRRKIVRRAKRRIRKCIYSEVVPLIDGHAG